jgi:hypothetical protein
MKAEALSFHRRASRCCFELPQCVWKCGHDPASPSLLFTLAGERGSGVKSHRSTGPLPRTEQPLNQVASVL